MALFNPDLNEVYTLSQNESWQEGRHRFDRQSMWAIRTALAVKRPLLIRGEAGIGKSQLARATAQFLGVPFLYHVVNARSECSDLLYTYDAVSRLAQAQVMGGEVERGDLNWKRKLDENRFVSPGVLWWAFDWKSAQNQARAVCKTGECINNDECCERCLEPSSPKGWKPGKGCVVLIDEIDKADSEVPNGLLESLGNTGFAVPYTGETVAIDNNDISPLIIITTNEERELPAAFLRRCLVLQMSLGADDDEIRTFLMGRGRDHFSEEEVSEEVCAIAIEQLLKDRKEARKLGPALPGAAEYLDILKALRELYPGDTVSQKDTLDRISSFSFRKNDVRLKR